MKSLCIGIAVIGLVAIGCGDDDTTASTTTSTTSGTTASTGGGSSTTTTGGGGGMGGNAPSGAAAFCAGFSTTCTYGDPYYADEAACIAAFDGYNAATQTCVVMHLGLAGSDADLHCPHANGAGPCAGL